jgi:CRP-like cAMP-binding protein
MLDSLPITKREFNEIAIDLDLSDCNGSPELVAAFSRKAVAVTCTENEVLFQKGEPGTSVYLVRSGEVSLLLPIARTRGIGFRAKPGSLVGLPAAFGNEPYSMTAIAWEDSEIAVMSRERFCDLVASDHALSLDVLRILAAETRAARVAIVEASAKRRHSKCL